MLILPDDFIWPVKSMAVRISLRTASYGHSRFLSFSDLPIAIKFVAAGGILASFGIPCLGYIVYTYASINDMVLNLDLTQTRNRSFVADEVHTFACNTSIFIAVAIVTGLSMAAFIGHKVSRPLSDLRYAMQKMVDGAFDTPINAQDRLDEVGDIARALVVFQRNGLEVLQLRAREKAKRDEEKATRVAFIKDLKGNFDEKLRSVSDAIQTAASLIDENSSRLADLAESSMSQAAGAVTTAGCTSESTRAIAAATAQIGRAVTTVTDQMS